LFSEGFWRSDNAQNAALFLIQVNKVALDGPTLPVIEDGAEP
jgi:hypothetical protein